MPVSHLGEDPQDTIYQACVACITGMHMGVVQTTDYFLELFK